MLTPHGHRSPLVAVLYSLPSYHPATAARSSRCSTRDLTLVLATHPTLTPTPSLTLSPILTPSLTLTLTLILPLTRCSTRRSSSLTLTLTLTLQPSNPYCP